MDEAMINATGSENPDENGTATEQQQTGPTGQTQEQEQGNQREAPSAKRHSGDAFTKEDVDKIKSAQFTAGKLALLKELGIAPEHGKDASAQIAEIKAWKEAQMTEAQKAQAQIETLKGELATAQAAADAQEKKMAAFAAGVPTDKVDRYIRLAEAMEGDGSFADKLKQTMDEYPPQRPAVPKITTGQSKQGTGSAPLYTLEQIQRMTPADINKNWPAVQASLAAGRRRKTEDIAP